MHQFAALCCTYEDYDWLRFAVESVYSEVGAVFFLVGDRPWNGPHTSNGETLAAIAALDDPGKKFQLVRGSWPTETIQRNAGLQLIGEAGFPYCFVLDADEIYDPLALRRMQAAALSQPDIGCWYMSMFTYWKSHRFRIDPPEQFNPPIFLKLGLAQFADKRNVFARGHAVIPASFGICHHLSYARSNEQLLRKLSTFSHSHEIRPNWYEEVWLKWDQNPALENLHPVYPEAYKRAIPVSRDELPPVLRNLF